MSDSSGAQSAIAPSSTPTSQAQQSPALGQNVPEKHRVKVLNEERELTLDELKRDYQLREASNKRFQEASQLQRKLQPMLEAFERGDFKQLLGPKAKSAEFRKFAEEYLLEQIEYEELPEGEKRRLAAERRAQELEDELKSRDEHTKKTEYQRSLAEAGQAVDTEIAQVLQKLGKPATPYLVVRIIDEMIARQEATDGGERVSAEKAYQMAQKRLDKDVEAYLEDLSEDDLVKRLSPKKLDAIRKHFLSQVGMQQQPKRNASVDGKPTPRRDIDEKPKTIDEAFKDLEARFGGKRRKA